MNIPLHEVEAGQRHKNKNKLSKIAKKPSGVNSNCVRKLRIFKEALFKWGLHSEGLTSVRVKNNNK